jgi:excinuclease UvrABC helicase subunit UvrB
MNNFQMTDEQKEILSLSKEEKDIAIQALAGCTKTSTLKFIAERNMKDSLYIAFNKVIATEAEKEFPAWVKCKTIHSLAYGKIVKGTGFARLAGVIK